MNPILRGTYRGKTYRLKVECYSRTQEIKVQLLPTDGSDRITITQDLGQNMPFYQAFLADDALDMAGEFMALMEQNGLGYILDYRRHNVYAAAQAPCKAAVLFQFRSSALRKFHAAGCTSYERHYGQLKRRSAERRKRRMAS